MEEPQQECPFTSSWPRSFARPRVSAPPWFALREATGGGILPPANPWEAPPDDRALVSSLNDTDRGRVLGQASELRAIDLNLLPVLRQLLRTSSVSKAAAQLGMSQSATSDALKRLRRLLGDEILVRVGRSMTPTNYAKSLVDPLENVLGQIEAVLTPYELDVRNIRRRFVIATADTIVLALAPGLMARLAERAPKVTVQFVDLQWMDMHSLDSGQLDLVILPDLAFPGAHCNSFTVYTEEFVYIARAGGPATAEPLTRQRLSSLTTIAFRANPHSPLSTTAGDRSDVLRMPQFIPQGFLVERSDAIALVPRLLAERLTELLHVEIIEPPFDFPTVNVKAFWGSSQDADPTHRWFRSLIQELRQ